MRIIMRHREGFSSLDDTQVVLMGYQEEWHLCGWQVFGECVCVCVGGILMQNNNVEANKIKKIEF